MSIGDLPYELKLIFKRILKRDLQTRIKGLEDLVHWLTNECNSIEVFELIRAQFNTLYIQGIVDIERPIREVTSSSLLAITLKDRKWIASSCKDILVYWVGALYDQKSILVCENSKLSFESAFPFDKIGQVRKAISKQVVDRLQDLLNSSIEKDPVYILNVLGSLYFSLSESQSAHIMDDSLSNIGLPPKDTHTNSLFLNHDDGSAVKTVALKYINHQDPHVRSMVLMNLLSALHQGIISEYHIDDFLPLSTSAASLFIHLLCHEKTIFEPDQLQKSICSVLVSKMPPSAIARIIKLKEKINLYELLPILIKAIQEYTLIDTSRLEAYFELFLQINLLETNEQSYSTLVDLLLRCRLPGPSLLSLVKRTIENNPALFNSSLSKYLDDPQITVFVKLFTLINVSGVKMDLQIPSIFFDSLSSKDCKSIIEHALKLPPKNVSDILSKVLIQLLKISSESPHLIIKAVAHLGENYVGEKVEKLIIEYWSPEDRLTFYQIAWEHLAFTTNDLSIPMEFIQSYYKDPTTTLKFFLVTRNIDAAIIDYINKHVDPETIAFALESVNFDYLDPQVTLVPCLLALTSDNLPSILQVESIKNAVLPVLENPYILVEQKTLMLQKFLSWDFSLYPSVLTFLDIHLPLSDENLENLGKHFQKSLSIKSGHFTSLNSQPVMFNDGIDVEETTGSFKYTQKSNRHDNHNTEGTTTVLLKTLKNTQKSNSKSAHVGGLFSDGSDEKFELFNGLKIHILDAMLKFSDDKVTLDQSISLAAICIDNLNDHDTATESLRRQIDTDSLYTFLVMFGSTSLDFPGSSIISKLKAESTSHWKLVSLLLQNHSPFPLDKVIRSPMPLIGLSVLRVEKCDFEIRNNSECVRFMAIRNITWSKADIFQILAHAPACITLEMHSTELESIGKFLSDSLFNYNIKEEYWIENQLPLLKSVVNSNLMSSSLKYRVLLGVSSFSQSHVRSEFINEDQIFQDLKKYKNVDICNLAVKTMLLKIDDECFIDMLCFSNYSPRVLASRRILLSRTDRILIEAKHNSSPNEENTDRLLASSPTFKNFLLSETSKNNGILNYLATLDLFMALAEGANDESFLFEEYSTIFRDKIVSIALPRICLLLGWDSHLHFTAETFLFDSVINLDDDLALDVDLNHWAANLLMRMTKRFPSNIRTHVACLDKSNNLQQSIESNFVKFASPLMIEGELAKIRSIVSALPKHDSLRIKIESSRTSCSVVVQYSIEETIMSLVLRIPPTYPLAQIIVETGERLGVGEGRWRSWLLSMNTLLSGNLRISDAIKRWRDNVDRTLSGIEPCSVCYCVLQPGDRSLPGPSCKTCRNRFHSACLYRWFKTSGNATCPMCRSLF